MRVLLSALAAASPLLLVSSPAVQAQSDNATAKAALSFAWPLATTIARSYGAPDGSGGTLTGIAFTGQAGEVIRAAADGMALYAGPFRGHGDTLILDHGCGLHTVVAGPLRPLVEAGQKVRLGEQIGQVEDTREKSMEIYFELRRDGAPADPAFVMPPQGSAAPRRVDCSEAGTATVEVPGAQPPESQPANTKQPRTNIVWSGKWPWPVRGEILRAFGSGREDGIDIAVPEGTKVTAVAKGIVIYAGDGLKELGNTVLVRHEDSLVTVYGNLSALEVQRGQKVRRGDVIGKSGKSGAAPEPQLHFQVRKKSTPVDPAAYLIKP